jgi:hypothetical protein
MAAFMRSPDPPRVRPTLGRDGAATQMLVASVAAWRREAQGTAGRLRSSLEAGPQATQIRPDARRAREIVEVAI